MRDRFFGPFLWGLMMGVFTAIHEKLSEKDLYLFTILAMSIYVMLRDRGNVNERLIKALATTAGITVGFYASQGTNKEQGAPLFPVIGARHF